MNVSALSVDDSPEVQVEQLLQAVGSETDAGSFASRFMNDSPDPFGSSGSGLEDTLKSIFDQFQALREWGAAQAVYDFETQNLASRLDGVGDVGEPAPELDSDDPRDWLVSETPIGKVIDG